MESDCPVRLQPPGCSRNSALTCTDARPATRSVRRPPNRAARARPHASRATAPGTNLHPLPEACMGRIVNTCVHTCGRRWMTASIVWTDSDRSVGHLRTTNHMSTAVPDGPLSPTGGVHTPSSAPTCDETVSSTSPTGAMTMTTLLVIQIRCTPTSPRPGQARTRTAHHPVRGPQDPLNRPRTTIPSSGPWCLLSGARASRSVPLNPCPAATDAPAWSRPHPRTRWHEARRRGVAHEVPGRP